MSEETSLVHQISVHCSVLKEAPENTNGFSDEAVVHFNVGGWCFSVPKSKVAQFPDSVLWKETSALTGEEKKELFVDRDGYTFREVYYYLHTSQLSFSSCAELNLLYEQALSLQLLPLLQALDNLKDGKHILRTRPVDIPVAERASMNYWRTRKYINKTSKCPPKTLAFTGLREKTPLGLLDTPLIDTEEEVDYCFLPLGLVEKYPSLVNDDNLLWLSDNSVLIECEGSEFRFIVNFLRSGKIFLPENFSSIDVLEAEAEALGIPELTEAVKLYKSQPETYCRGYSGLQDFVRSPVQKQREAANLPLYPMALGLLVKYPDSSLGQLHVEGTLDWNKLYISGNGVLFEHVRNWLGTSKLPLTRSASELPGLCAYLDQMDSIYQHMKDALKTYLKHKTFAGSRGKDANWTATIKAFSLRQVVKVYVGSHWYATFLQTLLKFPELLLNDNKVYWIAHGQSLLIHGDGHIFRHILNFLRLGKLLLPSEFKEWPLLYQEVAEYQIPSLVEALSQCDAYRMWLKQQETHSTAFQFRNLELAASEKETELSEDVQDVQPSHTAKNVNQCADNWSRTREAQDAEESDEEKDRYTRISPIKGAKRRNPWEGYCQPSDAWGNSCGNAQPRSPPKKKCASGNLPNKSECRDTPIQKLISLVHGWDMASSKHTEDLQGPTSAFVRTDGQLPCKNPERMTPCKLPLASFLSRTPPELPGKSLVLGAAPKVQQHLANIGWCLPGTPAMDGSLSKASGPSIPEEIGHPTGGNAPAKKLSRQAEREEGAFSEPIKAAIDESWDSAGLILKIRHPLLVADDGSCMSYEDSTLYSTHKESVLAATAHKQTVAKGIVFLSFPLSQEEIFYARMCHFFLTDVILESIRQKDPKEITAQVELFVQRVWTQQITAKEFVADFLSLAPFKAKSHTSEKLMKWLEFTLPFARKYSCCINQVIRKGYFKSLSQFVLGKHLQKS